MTSPLEAFAEEVGGVDAGPVTCRGGGTQWHLGGVASPTARHVVAPSGVVEHQPEEMIVRVGAATTVAELQDCTLAKSQLVALEADRPEEATVGGLLACGRTGLRRLGRGPLRDCVLEVIAVTSTGRLVRSGAPLVKNVTGFDLCRLLVGSYGSLAFIAEVVLRCVPKPQTERWFCSQGADPFEVRSRLYKPLSVLWDGDRTWVGLAGYEVDVADQAAEVLAAFAEAPGPPPVPAGGTGTRLSLPTGDLRKLLQAPPGPTLSGGGWLAEIGVGVLHCDPAASDALVEGGFLPALGAAPPTAALGELHRRVKENFDPSGRLNPSRSPLADHVTPKTTRPNLGGVQEPALRVPPAGPVKR